MGNKQGKYVVIICCCFRDRERRGSGEEELKFGLISSGSVRVISLRSMGDLVDETEARLLGEC